MLHVLKVYYKNVKGVRESCFFISKGVKSYLQFFSTETRCFVGMFKVGSNNKPKMGFRCVLWFMRDSHSFPHQTCCYYIVNCFVILLLHHYSKINSKIIIPVSGTAERNFFYKNYSNMSCPYFSFVMGNLG